MFFGSFDGPMTNDQIAAAGFRILHLPTVLGGVVPVCSVPGVTAELRFNLPADDITSCTAPTARARATSGALQNHIAYGLVQNQAGEFVAASTQTVTNAAAAAAKKMPKDFRVSITNAPGHADFVRWALTDGQRFAPALGYAPVPAEVVALELDALKRVRQ